MERKHWIILILVLVVFAALYLAVTAYGIGKGSRPLSMEEIQASVAGTLQKFLGDSTPRIDGSRLQCNGQRLNRMFQLGSGVGNDRCKITIYPSAEKYRKTTLRLVNAQPSVDIYVASDRMDKKQSEGFKQECIAYSEVKSAPGLDVYFPGEWADKPESACWSKAERKGSESPTVDIVAMKEGGNLTLVCRWCESDGQRRLQMSLE